MAKTRPSDTNYKGFSDPSVTKIEWYRGYTTKNPLKLDEGKISHSLHRQFSNGDLSVKSIVDEYRKSSNGNFLHAQNINYKIVFTRNSVKHDFIESNKSKTKISILTNYNKMNHLLSHGTVVEKRVKTTNRYGQESQKKKNWERYWEVKGSTYIGERLHDFTFSIVKSKGQNLARVYDFSLRKNGKKRAL